MTRLVCFSCAATERDGAEFPDVVWFGEQKLAVFVIGTAHLCLDCMREAVRKHEDGVAVSLHGPDGMHVEFGTKARAARSEL